MTSRERVLAAVNHKQPDRVPMGLSFSPEAQAKAMAHLGIHEDRTFWDWTGNDSVYVAPDFPGEDGQHMRDGDRSDDLNVAVVT